MPKDIGKKTTMIKVLEVDQWTSTGNVANFSMEEWEKDTQGTLAKVAGGDSEAIKVIFGGRARVLTVHDFSQPYIGDVWFKEENGKLVLYKCNYDSSD